MERAPIQFPIQRAPRQLRHRMITAVVVSALFHVLVIAARGTAAHPAAESLGSDAVSFQIENAKGTARSPTRSGLPQLASTPRETAARRSAFTSGADAATAAASTSPATLTNYLLGRLHTELSRYLAYPPQARERGWEGTVVLRVVIAPDGELLDTQLATSSGYAAFDEASINGVRRLHRLRLDPAYRPDRIIEVLLPIEFRLTDNT
jgi:periplasmic protein TonB